MHGLESVQNFLWGLTADWVTLVGVFLTLGLQFLPLKRLPWSLLQLGLALRHRTAGSGEISAIAALMTSLAGTLGIGHLSGMAISLRVGGPGIIPWMWLIALVGMATRFSETFLAVRFRQRDPRGLWIGGPMEAIRHGLGPHWNLLAVLFALFATIGVFGLGNGVQAQQLALGLHQLSGLPPLPLGMVTAALVWLALRGGLPRISRLALLVVPAMTLLYLMVVTVLLGLHADRLPAALSRMLEQAFHPQVLAGGSLALMVRTAVRTAVFANEAGLGTSPIAHAAASPADPLRQGAIAMLGNLISVLVCTATALLLLSSGVLDSQGPITNRLGGEPDGLLLLQEAFQWGLAGSGWIATTSLVLFAFTTLVTFGFYGERCLTFVVGPRGRRAFQLAWIGALVLASSQAVPDLWGLGNTLDALMVLPNLLALVLLSGTVFQSVVGATPCPDDNPFPADDRDDGPA
jgi:alanine or glycine:cation symporter, AGCS family